MKIPLWGVRTDGSCECGNAACGRNAGKHTRLYSYDQADPSWTPNGAPYGILTGAKSGIVVVDIDVKDGKDGLGRLLDWAAKYGGFPETLTVRTPSGGQHWYFTHPGFPVPTTRGWPVNGVDMRGDGGMVVGPGVSTINGDYVVVNATVPVPIPAWFLTVILERAAGLSEANAPYTCTAEQLPRNVERGRELCSRWTPAVSGQGGSNWTFILAGKLRREFGLPADTCVELMSELYNPRCEPPWTRAELEHKVRSAETRVGWDYVPDLVIDFDPREAAEAVNVREASEEPHTYAIEVGRTEAAPGKLEKLTMSALSSLFASHPSWAGTLRFDLLKTKPVAVRPPVRLPTLEEQGGIEEIDVTAALVWLEHNGQTSSREAIRFAIDAACRLLEFNPIEDWLKSLAPTSPDFLDHLSRRMFNTTMPEADLVLRKFLIAAVRRALVPGTKVKTTLILKGDQGAGKSPWVAAMFGPWNKENMPSDLGSDKACDAIRGAWGVELGELDSVLRTNLQTAKDFLGRDTDSFRRVYQREDRTFKRSCVFVGTTNDDDFLKDATGDSRFWPIEVIGKIDLDFVQRNKEAIWAAAYAAHLTGEEHWLPSEAGQLEVIREPFREVDPWTPAIEEYLRGREEVTNTTEIYTRALAGGSADTASVGRKEQLRIASVLKRLGCKTKARRNEVGRMIKVWVVPEALTSKATKPSPLFVIPQPKDP